MSERLKALTARRMALQAECALQRDDVRQLYGGIEGTAVRADRANEVVRPFTPLFAIGGIAVLFALGPGRALRLLRNGLSITLYANQARLLFR